MSECIYNRIIFDLIRLVNSLSILIVNKDDKRTSLIVDLNAVLSVSILKKNAQLKL